MLRKNGNLSEEKKKRKSVSKTTKKISRKQAKDAFKRADQDKSGFLGFEEIREIEKDFDLPLSISGNASAWKDGKIDINEFLDMLRKNGNLSIEIMTARSISEISCRYVDLV